MVIKKTVGNTSMFGNTRTRSTATWGNIISWQRPTTNIKPDMVCVKLIEITE